MWRLKLEAALKTIRRFPWQQASGLLCLSLVLLCFALDREQGALADKMLRLHVLAHSDSREDQSLKLRLRDEILVTVEPWLGGEQDAAAARQLLAARLPELQMEAQRFVREEGFDYPVTLKVEEAFFPTRHYEGFALPAGNYQSLRVIIGDGAGRNWWCVVFPPLCNAASTETLAKSAGRAGLTEQEVFLILEESDEYVIKFKLIELWEQLKHAIN